MDQSKSPFESLTSIRSPTSSTKKQQLELLEPANPKQKNASRENDDGSGYFNDFI